jgi:hypothetical protein
VVYELFRGAGIESPRRLGYEMVSLCEIRDGSSSLAQSSSFEIMGALCVLFTRHSFSNGIS